MLSFLYTRINGVEARSSLRLVKIRRDRGAFFAGIPSAVYRIETGCSVLGYVSRPGLDWQALDRQGNTLALSETFSGLKRILGAL